MAVICMPHSVPVAPVNTSVLSMRTSDLTHSILSNLSDLEVLDLLMSVMLLSICIVVGVYSSLFPLTALQFMLQCYSLSPSLGIVNVILKIHVTFE